MVTLTPVGLGLWKINHSFYGVYTDGTTWKYVPQESAGFVTDDYVLLSTLDLTTTEWDGYTKFAW